MPSPPPIKFAPPPSPSPSPSTPHTTTQRAVSLLDIIGSHRSISTFASWTRRSERVTSLLSSPGGVTVLAPLNPVDVPAFTNKTESAAADALERFVMAHVVGEAPWEGKTRTLAGREVWWEERGRSRVVMPDGVEVERVAARVGNGELWLLRRPLGGAWGDAAV